MLVLEDYEHARARGAIKRGSGAISLTLSHADGEAPTSVGGPDVVDVLALHQAQLLEQGRTPY